MWDGMAGIGTPGTFGGAEPLVLVLLALVLEALLGGLKPRLPAVGRAVLDFEQRLNREKRSAGTRIIRGLLLVALGVSLAGLGGWAVQSVAVRVPFGWLIELAFLAAVLRLRKPVDHAWRLARSGAPAGSAADAEPYATARSAIEDLAGNLNTGLVAPLFWYLLLGLPGLLAYRAAALLDRVLGGDAPRLLDFGAAARRFHAAVAVLPSLIAGLLLVVAAAPTPGANPGRAFAAMTAVPREARAWSRFWPWAATAGALNLVLGGPRPGSERSERGVWIGPPEGRARTGAEDVRRALYLAAVASLLVFALAAVMALERLAP
jgi:adenosylcobinamide-phosphate synthase